jgi:hypothetical protein
MKCEREKPEYGIAEYLHEVRIALESTWGA